MGARNIDWSVNPEKKNDNICKLEQLYESDTVQKHWLTHTSSLNILSLPAKFWCYETMISLILQSKAITFMGCEKIKEVHRDAKVTANTLNSSLEFGHCNFIIAPKCITMEEYISLKPSVKYDYVDYDGMGQLSSSEGNDDDEQMSIVKIVKLLFKNNMFSDKALFSMTIMAQREPKNVQHFFADYIKPRKSSPTFMYGAPPKGHHEGLYVVRTVGLTNFIAEEAYQNGYRLDVLYFGSYLGFNNTLQYTYLYELARIEN